MKKTPTKRCAMKTCKKTFPVVKRYPRRYCSPACSSAMRQARFWIARVGGTI